MDQQWDRNLSSKNSYDVKDMLAEINRIVSAEGNIDWGLAHHPYAYPLDNTTFWNSSGKIRSLITASENTSIVTMENIQVVTDYLQRPEMLTAEGEVRPVILSELGYSSLDGEVNQAAAFAYAYYAADSNPYIDAMILSRQTDARKRGARPGAGALHSERAAEIHLRRFQKYRSARGGDLHGVRKIHHRNQQLERSDCQQIIKVRPTSRRRKECAGSSALFLYDRKFHFLSYKKRRSAEDAHSREKVECCLTATALGASVRPGAHFFFIR